MQLKAFARVQFIQEEMIRLELNKWMVVEKLNKYLLEAIWDSIVHYAMHSDSTKNKYCTS